MNEDFAELQKFLQQLREELNLNLDAEVEVHVVPMQFTWGSCEECGDANCALLPVGLNGMLVCAECGQRYANNVEAHLETLFEDHLKSHAAQWN